VCGWFKLRKGTLCVSFTLFPFASSLLIISHWSFVLSPSEPECTLPVQCTQILKVPYVLLHCFPTTLPLHPRNLQNTSSSKSPQNRNSHIPLISVSPKYTITIKNARSNYELIRNHSRSSYSAGNRRVSNGRNSTTS